MLQVKNLLKVTSTHPAATAVITPRLVPSGRLLPYTDNELFVWKYPRPTYFYFPRFTTLTLSVSLHKALAWFSRGIHFITPLRLVNRPAPYSWIAPESRRELRPLVSTIKQRRPPQFKRKRPRLISTRIKRKHRTKLMRRWLTQLAQLTIPQKALSRFIRLITKAPSSPLSTTLFIFHPLAWFLFLRLGAAKPWIPQYGTYCDPTPLSAKARTPTLLPLSHKLYIHALVHIYEFFPFAMRTAHLQPQPKSYALNKPLHNKLPIPPLFLQFYDVPRRIEIDYTTLSIFLLPTKTQQYFDWYGSLLYLNWNFIHSYNWAYHF